MARDINRFRGWAWLANNTRWTSGMLGLRWLVDVLEPNTTAPDQRFLILDNQASFYGRFLFALSPAV